jgi:ComF family protein
MYNTPARAIIHDLKYRGLTGSVQLLFNLAGPDWIDELGLRDAEAIIPVPLHRVRLRQRGYNQAEVIADLLSDRLGIPVFPDVVERHVATSTQTRLDPVERRRNLEDVFRIRNAETIRGRRLLVVDDVFTTGATVDSISKSLTTNGAADVLVFTLTRAGTTRI